MDPFLLMILVVGLGGLLLLNWRTRKKQQEQLSFRDRLQIGQRVQTIGLVIGTITALDGDHVTIETTPGTEIVFHKHAMARLIDDPSAPETDADYPDSATDEDAETTTEHGADTEVAEDAVARSPEVPEEASTSVSPDSGDDDSPRSTQN
ncbi:preprotein translocase subunit YajC [Ruania albidiflava]|uniref:preprotein translocase subunit YajC n=1 Tax=Ruania albidiflava TaxID=366586 RepID=UPI0003B6B1DE|nr:preprotein translocase subunit YajC [Ruania albidiflava]